MLSMWDTLLSSELCVEFDMTIVKSNAEVIANIIADDFEYDAQRLNVNIVESVYRSFELNARNGLNTASS